MGIIMMFVIGFLLLAILTKLIQFLFGVLSTTISLMFGLILTVLIFAFFSPFLLVIVSLAKFIIPILILIFLINFFKKRNNFSRY